MLISEIQKNMLHNSPISTPFIFPVIPFSFVAIQLPDTYIENKNLKPNGIKLSINPQVCIADLFFFISSQLPWPGS